MTLQGANEVQVKCGRANTDTTLPVMLLSKYFSITVKDQDFLCDRTLSATLSMSNAPTQPDKVI